MPTIAMLKQDMESTKSLGDIVDVLKIAALMQFHAFQLKEGKPKQDFLNIAEDIFNVLVSKGLEHPFLLDRPILPSLIVVITSDEGFLGDLNMLAINAALNIVKTSEDHILCLGRRGARYLEDTDVSYKVFPGVSSEINPDELEPLKLYILNGYKKKFGRVYIIYPKFISLVVQKIDKVLLLPYQKSSQAKILRGFFIDEMLIEPAISHVLEILIEIYLGFRLLDIFWMSKRSEYAARIMHLEGSTQELSTLNQKLSFNYFRQEHALKDKSIREISASKVISGRR